ncbi:MAG: glycosyltransferase family 2 protein [Candidatus Omnitrophica bacterium]|nr:glycosyltransferase family 2 protein [Candidatus Omnitrophota bacterium]
MQRAEIARQYENKAYMQSQKHKISVIVITYNQKDTIATCLESILKLNNDNYEVIVIDDCSQDGTAEIAERFPCQLIKLDKHRGAAFARNRGAEQASGNILFFLDSDVIAANNALSEILKMLQDHPAAQAVQGRYLQESVPKNIVTQYKDYFNNYKSQWIESDCVNIIATYCFAIRRQAFFEAGGFDAKIPGATVEDNDLGYRLFESGNLVVLNRNLTVTHLKRYSLKSLLKRAYIVSFNMVKFFLRIRFTKQRKNASRNFSYIRPPQELMAGSVFRPSLPAGQAGNPGFKPEGAPFIPLSSGKKTNLYLAMSLVLSFVIFSFGIYTFLNFKMHYLALFLSLMLVFILINLKYLLLLSKIKGWRFCSAWIGIFYLDMLFAFFGLLHGGVDFFIFQRKY